MRLQAFNPSTQNLEKSYLSNSYAAGVTTIVVRNNNNFTTSDRLMIGEMGREKTEIVTPNTINADGVTVLLSAGTKFPHSADDPVYVLRYDQVKFYRSTTGINGSYSALATVAMDVDNADLETYYDDNTGLTTYYYEISFYHSVKAIESSLSDPMPGGSYDRTMVGALVDEFLTEIGDIEQKDITVPQILSLLNECNDDLLLATRRPYRFLRTKWLLSTTAGNNRISFASLTPPLWKIDYQKYNYTWSGTNRTDETAILDIHEMDFINWDNTALGDDNLQYIAIDPTTNEFVLYPTPLTSQSNVATLYGWKKFTTFTGLGSTFETPHYRVYKMFLMQRYYLMKSKTDNKYLAQYREYKNDYSGEVVKLQRANKLDIGTPMGLRPDSRRARGLRR